MNNLFKTILVGSLFLVFSIFGFGNAAKAVVNVTINDNVSATANSGGNTQSGSGEIKTGSAKAESSVTTNVSGGKTKVDMKAEATANDKTETKEIHKETNENMNAEVKAEASSNDNSGTNLKTEENQLESPVPENKVEVQAESSRENQGFVANIENKIGSFFSNITDKILNIFSLE